jgi:hypothetical protein
MQETDDPQQQQQQPSSSSPPPPPSTDLSFSQVLVNIFPVAKFEENTRRVRGGGADHM